VTLPARLVDIQEPWGSERALQLDKQLIEQIVSRSGCLRFRCQKANQGTRKGIDEVARAGRDGDDSAVLGKLWKTQAIHGTMVL